MKNDVVVFTDNSQFGLESQIGGFLYNMTSHIDFEVISTDLQFTINPVTCEYSYIYVMIYKK